MRSPRAAVAALVLLGAAGLSGCNKIKARQEIKKGNEFFKATQYQAALANYLEAQRLDPGEKRLDKFIGETYMAMYQPGSKHPKDLEFGNNAIKRLESYLAAYPNDRKVRPGVPNSVEFFSTKQQGFGEFACGRLPARGRGGLMVARESGPPLRSGGAGNP